MKIVQTTLALCAAVLLASCALSVPSANRAALTDPDIAQMPLERARIALENAARTNPTYAPAQENLGDVYAKLAVQSYNKTLLIDANNVTAPSKLDAIEPLFSPEARERRRAMVAAAPAPAPVVTPPPVVAPEPVAALDNSAIVARDVETAVYNWARAWASKDVPAYLGAYSKDFITPSGQARNVWEAERRSRIGNKARINVRVSDLQVETMGERAAASFKQDYSSDLLKSTDHKTLEMVKEGGRWLIVREFIK